MMMWQWFDVYDSSQEVTLTEYYESYFEGEERTICYPLSVFIPHRTIDSTNARVKDMKKNLPTNCQNLLRSKEPTDRYAGV